MRWWLLLLLGCFAVAAQAGEPAYTVRPTELKAKPFSDAATLMTLAEHSELEVLVRQASWMRVKVNDKTGWVKMLSLRFGDAAQQKSGDSGLAALFNVAKSGSSGSTVTTGVRGLSEENLRNPHPNPQELKKLQRYKVSKNTARQFARSGKLKAEQVAYLPAK